MAQSNSSSYESPQNNPQITTFSRAHTEHQQLLANLKSISHSFFQCSSANNSTSVRDQNIFSRVPEALPKLHLVLEKIFSHGIRVFKNDGSPDIWHFIEGLNWLNPALAISIGSLTPKKSVHVPFSRIKYDNALLWIYENLNNLTLSNKLRWLISDYEHLAHCYEVTAYLRNEKYSAALIMCLQAIEQNQQSLFTQIDEGLLGKTIKDSSHHKRSSSHPNFNLCVAPNVAVVTKKPPPSRSKTKSTIERAIKAKRVVVDLNLRPWSSLPNLKTSSPKIRSRSKTISQPINIPNQRPYIRLTADTLQRFNENQKKPPSFTYRQFPSDSGGSSGGGGKPSENLNELKPITIVKCDDIEIHVDRKYASPKDGPSPIQPSTSSAALATPTQTPLKHPGNLYNNSKSDKKSKQYLFPSFFDPDIEDGETSYSFFSKSAPSDLVSTFVPTVGVKLKSPHSIHPQFTEDGQFSIPQSTGTGYFPRPTQGQSLASFLQTAQFSRTNTELDRENAHFSVAEAMISAIEQLKWTNFEKYNRKGGSWSESGEEKLFGRSPSSKRIKKRKKRLKCWDGDEINKEAMVVSPSTTFSDSTNDDDDSSLFSNISSDSVSDDDEPNLSYLKTLSVSSHSLNDHAAYAEWGENTRDAMSAEGVALSLISKFGDKQLPRASELLWLVSEQDAPQQLLPMPGSWSVNPDVKYNSFLRGTRDWAPPRAQIIFTRHPAPDRKKMMTLQNNRCAGCGMRVAPNYSHRYRYCEYLGKYHCTGCHRNQRSVLPARVLHNWEFSNCPVSVFSYRLLNQIWTFPLFCVNDLNPGLYIKNTTLRVAKEKRIQLKYVKDFIDTCRFAVDNVRKLFDSVPNHITEDVDNWSMADFVAVKRGIFVQSVNDLIAKCEDHVKECELCMARGFFCEHCRKDQVLFPWQRKVRRCCDCGSCYHDTCWTGECLKCVRLRKRQN